MGMVLRIVFAFRVLIFFLGGREQLVENTGREFFAQHRTVGDKAIGVVDKRYAVDSPCGIDPENSVDTVRLELLPELVPCIVRAHGVFDRTAQMVERARLLHSFLGFCIIRLQGIITYVFPYFTRLEGRAYSITIVGHSSIDKPA